MDLNLTGKKAIICAASKGLGLAAATELHREGCKILICARGESDLKDATTHILQHSGRKEAPMLLAVDLSQPEKVKEFAEQALSLLGGVDILVNNVGGPQPSSAESTSHKQWNQGFDQVFLSATLLTQALIPTMKSQKHGRIITITSLSVLEPIEHLVVSTSMRTAVTTFMKTLSREVAPHGITVNTVMPGVIQTDRIIQLRKSKAERDGTNLEAELENTRRAIPVGRLGSPQELASLIAFLSSDKAGFITGVNIPVDGGMRHSWV